MSNKFPIDSRDIHSNYLNLKGEHSTWIKRLINRLDLVEGDDYITYKEGNKHLYKFTDKIYEDLSNKPNNVVLEDIVVLAPTAPEGYFEDNGELYIRSTTIAAMLEKSHFHVLRDLEKDISDMKERLRGEPNLDSVGRDADNTVLNGIKLSTYTDSRGKTQKEFILDYCAALAFVSRYSGAVRNRLAHAYVSYQKASEAYYKALSSAKASGVAVGQLYVITDGEAYKIGVAKDPERRLKQLQTGNKNPLDIVFLSEPGTNYYQVEKALHDKFKDYQVSGEWFRGVLLHDILTVIETSAVTLKQQGESQ